MRVVVHEKTGGVIRALSALLAVVLALSLCWLPAAAAGNTGPADAPGLDNPDALISIVPAAPSVGLSGTLRINVVYTPDSAWNLYGLDITMEFDPTRIQVIDGCPDSYPFCSPPGVNIVPGPLLVASGNQFPVANNANNTTGVISYVSAAMGGTPITDGGILLYMDVEATGLGNTCVEITSSYLSTIDGRLIPHATTIGCFDVYDPTAVTISSFTATGGSNAVTLNWSTASEVDNLGFNLYRAATADGAKTKINQEMISSQVNPGNPAGARYSYIDSKLDKTKLTYYYWLEDVDLSGRAELHGPVEAGLLAPWLKDPPPSEPPSVR